MIDDQNRLIEPEHSKDRVPPKDENQPPIHWATKGQRVAAWIGAIAMIIITLAYIYSIYSGTLFSH